MAVTMEEGRILKETCGISNQHVSLKKKGKNRVKNEILRADAGDGGMSAQGRSSTRKLQEERGQTPVFIQSIPVEFSTPSYATTFRNFH